jgi:hypothetical protein
MKRLSGIAATAKMTVRGYAIICTFAFYWKTAKAKPSVP